MIISAKTSPDQDAFNVLLKATLHELNLKVKKSEKEISLLLGNKLEPFIKDVMDEQAEGTVFENSIELISGQKFPDIVAKKFYGVEVKSTTQNHWRTTGNSVLESTRVEGVERIYMLFGKLGKPMEFRCRPYEECLSEIVVTHSPRYLIDMNLAKGATIFEKMKTSYDVLRKQPNPITPVVEYYKGQLKRGEDIWWMGQGAGDRPKSLIIRIWNNLSREEKNIIRVRSMVFFPELFGNRNDKFSRLAVWLVNSESIVCPNVRDLFTAGGRSDFDIDGITYRNVPKVIETLISHINQIKKLIDETSAHELSHHWQIKTTERSKLATWVKLVDIYSRQLAATSHLNLAKMIAAALK